METVETLEAPMPSQADEIPEPEDTIDDVEECKETKGSTKPYNLKVLPDDKRKKPRSDKQKAAWAACLAKRHANRDARLAEQKKVHKEQEKKIKEEDQVIAEKQIIRKAVKLKKKEVIRSAVLDELSDESSDSDVDIQAVKRYVKQKKNKRKARAEAKVEEKKRPPSLDLNIVRNTPKYQFY
jgi:hypothetical protein